eukprot:EG_transcript_5102
MDVVAVGQTSYVAGDSNETTPLLRPASQTSIVTTSAESVTLQTVPKRVTSRDQYRQDYLVMMGNISEAPTTRVSSQQSTPVLSWGLPSSHSLSSLQLPMFPVPAVAGPSPPFTPHGGLTRDQRLQLLKLQDQAAVPSRSYSDQLLTSGVPTEAAAYGLKTGMQGFLVGQDEDCNLLHVPAAAQAPPGWLHRLWPSRIKSLRLVSYNADAEHEPTLFFSQVEYARPLIGWFLLCVILGSFSLMAPFSRTVPVPSDRRLVASILVTGWRCSMAFLVMASVSLLWVRRYGLQPEQELFLRRGTSWLVLLQCGVFQSIGSCGYNVSLAYTTIPQAVLCCNLHPLLIIVMRLLCAQLVTSGEVLGVLLGLVGMGCVVGGGMLNEAPSGPAAPAVGFLGMLWGDFAGLMGSIGLCFFLITTKKIRSQVPVLLCLTIQMLVGSVATLSIAVLWLGAQFSTDPWVGLFGFVHGEWFGSWVIGGTLMLMGWFGASAVTKYLNPVVISTFLTLEPTVAVLSGVLMGVEAFPSWLTILGGAIMFCSTVLVSVSSHDEEEGKPVPVVLDDPHGLPPDQQQTLAALSEHQWRQSVGDFSSAQPR